MKNNYSSCFTKLFSLAVSVVCQAVSNKLLPIWYIFHLNMVLGGKHIALAKFICRLFRAEKKSSTTTCFYVENIHQLFLVSPSKGTYQAIFSLISALLACMYICYAHMYFLLLRNMLTYAQETSVIPKSNKSVPQFIKFEIKLVTVGSSALEIALLSLYKIFISDEHLWLFQRFRI